MKKLLLIPLIVLVSGCVTYYYPAPETTEGVYYAADDPSYTDLSASYASAAYYPWWSLDYFYLGHGYRGSSFSMGIGYGNPWYGYRNPWYGYYPYYYPPYYDRWYSPYYYHPYHHHHYAWYNPYWHHRYRNHHRSNHPGHDRQHDRYVSWDPDYNRNVDSGRRPDRMNPRGPGATAPRDYEVSGPGRSTGSRESQVSRRVSMAPSSSNSDRGMVVRSREEVKPGRSRLHPSQPVSDLPRERPAEPSRRNGSFSVVSSSKPDGTSVYSTSRSATSTSQQRYRSDSKQTRSRSGPVRIDSGSMVVTSPAPRTSRPPGQVRSPAPYHSRASSREVSPLVVQSRSSGMTVRSSSARKVPAQRTQPVHTSPGNVSGPGNSRAIPAAPRATYSTPRTTHSRSAGNAHRSSRAAMPSRSRGVSIERHREP